MFENCIKIGFKNRFCARQSKSDKPNAIIKPKTVFDALSFGGVFVYERHREHDQQLLKVCSSADF